jgi:hypothetical protein
MARCNSCNGVIARTDVDCYLCGDPIPGRAKFSLFRFWGKSTADTKASRAVQRVMMKDALRARTPDHQRTR